MESVCLKPLLKRQENKISYTRGCWLQQLLTAKGSWFQELGWWEMQQAGATVQQHQHPGGAQGHCNTKLWYLLSPWWRPKHVTSLCWTRSILSALHAGAPQPVTSLILHWESKRPDSHQGILFPPSCDALEVSFQVKPTTIIIFFKANNHLKYYKKYIYCSPPFLMFEELFYVCTVYLGKVSCPRFNCQSIKKKFHYSNLAWKYI